MKFDRIYVDINLCIYIQPCTDPCKPCTATVGVTVSNSIEELKDLLQARWSRIFNVRRCAQTWACAEVSMC